jgi:hypothetical protein
MCGSRKKSLSFDSLEQRAVPTQASSFSATLLPISPALADDPATGRVSISFSHKGSQANVVGSLLDISNVSAIVLRLPTIVTMSPGSSTSVNNFQTVAVLVKPGSGSGAFRHVTFGTGIDRFNLIGPLVNQPFSALLKQVRLGMVSVVVLTNNGVDPATSISEGNVQNGEIAGKLVPIGRKS